MAKVPQEKRPIYKHRSLEVSRAPPAEEGTLQAPTCPDRARHSSKKSSRSTSTTSKSWERTRTTSNALPVLTDTTRRALAPTTGTLCPRTRMQNRIRRPERRVGKASLETMCITSRMIVVSSSLGSTLTAARTRCFRRKRQRSKKRRTQWTNISTWPWLTAPRPSQIKR